MIHVIWDWNGTLLADLAVTVAAANAALSKFGGGPVDAEVYRDHYTRPVKVFYERVLGRTISDREWLACDGVWRAAYGERMGEAELAEGALEVLAHVDQHPGAQQSILSMWWHDELPEITRRYGVDGYMARVDGNDGRSGARKAGLMRRHIAALGVAPERVVAVGDSVDDFEAAQANGVRCVLIDSGTHHRHELVSTGQPVVTRLRDALSVIGL